MISYFRIIAYHPTKNLSVIMDSNGIFEKLWQFTVFMISNSFKIIEMGTEKKFSERDLPKVEYDNVTSSFEPAKADSQTSRTIALW